MVALGLLFSTVGYGHQVGDDPLHLRGPGALRRVQLRGDGDGALRLLGNSAEPRATRGARSREEQDQEAVAESSGASAISRTGDSGNRPGIGHRNIARRRSGHCFVRLLRNRKKDCKGPFPIRERCDRGGGPVPRRGTTPRVQTSFIPLLTLGLPSNPTMALMAAGMTIHGIVPGPQVMTLHPELFWGMIASMWIGNLMLLVLNLPLIGLWVQVPEGSVPAPVPVHSADLRGWGLQREQQRVRRRGGCGLRAVRLRPHKTRVRAGTLHPGVHTWNHHGRQLRPRLDHSTRRP